MVEVASKNTAATDASISPSVDPAPSHTGPAVTASSSSSVDVQALAFALWSRRDDPAFATSTVDLIR
jgi:hypothetical protein